MLTRLHLSSPPRAPPQAKEAAAESRLVSLLYERESKTGIELASRIMALKARIGKLQEARRTLDAIAEESAAAAPALQRPQFWG